MALAEGNFQEIRGRVLDAYKNEDPIMAKFRKYARRLTNDIKPIRKYSVNAVSFVSADGGDNRLFFNPAVIELVRVSILEEINAHLTLLPGIPRNQLSMNG
ncbi:hypothetical protein [Daejeonella sp.]|uniref:hypothetical protein n=1 Tax=Daejeonella sp. TaxID=2805397 RepID=UPI0030C47158